MQPLLPSQVGQPAANAGGAKATTTNTTPTVPADNAKRPARTSCRKCIFMFPPITYVLSDINSWQSLTLIVFNQRQSLGNVAGGEFADMRPLHSPAAVHQQKLRHKSRII